MVHVIDTAFDCRGFLQASKDGGVADAAAPLLNVTYDSKQQSATFTTIPDSQNAAPGGSSSYGQLLLPITHLLTSVYGLSLSSAANRAALMRVPSTGAVVKTSSGGHVNQLALTLAGAWTPAKLSAVLGVQDAALQKQQQGGGLFTVSEPTLLFSAAPSALYVAMTTSINSLGVDGGPATLNLKPGGQAALAVRSCSVPTVPRMQHQRA